MQYNRQQDRNKDITEQLLEASSEEDAIQYHPSRRLERSRLSDSNGLSDWTEKDQAVVVIRQRVVSEQPRHHLSSSCGSRKLKKERPFRLPSLEQLTKRLIRNNSEESTEIRAPPKSMRRHSENPVPSALEHILSIKRYQEPKIVSISLDMTQPQKIIKLHRPMRHPPRIIPINYSDPPENQQRKAPSPPPEVRLTRKAEQLKMFNQQVAIYVNPVVAKQMMELKNPTSKFSSVRFAHQKNIRLNVRSRRD